MHDRQTVCMTRQCFTVDSHICLWPVMGTKHLGKSMRYRLQCMVYKLNVRMSFSFLSYMPQKPALTFHMLRPEFCGLRASMNRFGLRCHEKGEHPPPTLWEGLTVVRSGQQRSWGLFFAAMTN